MLELLIGESSPVVECVSSSERTDGSNNRPDGLSGLARGVDRKEVKSLGADMGRESVSIF